MPGLVQALQCNSPGLPGGKVYAFQLNSSANFRVSWDNFNRWWSFDVSRAGTTCPPTGSNRQGAYAFKSNDFPPRAGQVVECQAVRGSGGGGSTGGASTGGGSTVPAYAWALPSDDAFFVAQGADGSSFAALNSWWLNDSMPTARASPQAS